MEKQLRILCAILFMGSLLVFEQAFAGTVELPRTNSGICVDSDYKSIACAGTGQDGDKQKGVAIHPRYKLRNYRSGSGEQVVIDDLTGLVWPKDVNCANLDVDHWMLEKEIHYKGKTWVDAMQSVANFNRFGLCDVDPAPQEAPWRLPNRKELFSMLQYYASEDRQASIFKHGFWTSSTYAYDPEKAWVVNAYTSVYFFDNPFLDSVTSDDKNKLNFFWPVRNRTASDY